MILKMKKALLFLWHKKYWIILSSIIVSVSYYLHLKREVGIECSQIADYLSEEGNSYERKNGYYQNYKICMQKNGFDN